MSDSQSPNHWSQLASELGAEPIEPPPPLEPAAESLPSEPESPPVFPPAVVPPKISHDVPRSSRPTEAPAAPDWDALAKNLGIEVPPAPPEAIVEDVSPVEESYSEEATAEEEALDIAEYLSREEAEALLFGGEGPLPPSPVEDAASTGSRKRRRRKRHDRQRDQKQPAPPPELPKIESADVSRLTWKKVQDFETEPIVREEDSPELFLGEDEEERSLEDRAEPPSQRGNRRAGRRKKRKPKSSGEPSDKRTLREEIASDDESVRPDDGLRQEERIDADWEEEDQGEREQKSSFRAIPTWPDAIGVIIAKNMESRGKRPPSSGGSRGGGSRGGGSRGGGSRGGGSREKRRQGKS
ncbi:MAG: hypothetical protein JXB10_02500 [Pirellulales bacterium]|nr:hypothetical protein [Pirellulales bacterium]